MGSKALKNDRAIVGDTDPASRNIPKRLRPAKITRPETSVEKTETYRQEKSQKVFKRTLKSTAVNGAMNLLVIGVQFEDHPATYSTDKIQPLLFGESGSIADYFNDVSYGAVTINPASEFHGTSNDGFIGWLQLSGNHPNTGSDKDHETDYQTAKNAITVASDYIDFASYDADGDADIESTELAILIIVAGYAAEYSGGNDPSVWSHKSGGSFESDGKYIYEYAMVGEKHGDHMGTIGHMVHELGHLIFDLPDLYDTDKDNGDSYGIGYFGLMGSDNWGAKYGENGGSSPTHPCAWSKEYLSWGTVNTITSSQTISLPKGDGNSSSMFRLDTSDPDQYFLIENRQFSGYDIGFQRLAGSPGHGGIVIYHIDTSKTDMWPGSNDINADENDKGVDVEEANEGSIGYSMLDTYEKAAHTNMFYFSGNNYSFSNSTTPNSRLKNNNATQISITSISSYGDTMSASVTRPPTATTGSVANVELDSATLNRIFTPSKTHKLFIYGKIVLFFANNM
ncbi:MAG: M6 family metalloprotease domain-containing protein [Candidatus Kuenenia sp.]|nr:M6 family metalloprotease domain-containing protein [Candidatus Kuenenia hertensis]